METGIETGSEILNSSKMAAQRRADLVFVLIPATGTTIAANPSSRHGIFAGSEGRSGETLEILI